VLPDWPFHGQFLKIWPLLSALAMKKTHLAISSVCHCKMKFPLHVEVFLYFVGEFHVTVAVTLTVALQPCIALKCVAVI